MNSLSFLPNIYLLPFSTFLWNVVYDKKMKLIYQEIIIIELYW